MTVAFAERLTVVDELMGTLELVTRAGQQHVMNRILSILRGEILSLGFPLATANLASLLDAMAELEHEAGRIAPTAAASTFTPASSLAFWANLIRRFFRCYLLKLRSGLLLLPGPSMMTRWTPNRD